MRWRAKFSERLWFYSCRTVTAAVLVVWAGSMSWASPGEIHRPCSRRGAGNHSAVLPETDAAGRNRAGKIRQKGAAGFCPAPMARSFAEDQKTIWTSPFRLHAQDTNWLLPVGVGLFGLMAADNHIMQHFVSTPVAHSDSFSNYGLATMVGGAASLYPRGITNHDEHERETGFLAGEAAVNSLIVAESMKLAFGRARPDSANAGRFGAGGASFPSEHAFAAWSIASVVAHEYPGPLTKLLAYGAASGISGARVAAREHFPSDVIVGGALGYLIGRYVYGAHHDRELPGASGNEFGDDSGGDNKSPEKKQLTEKEPPPARKPSRFASPYVPLDSWVYAAFDRLAGLGYASSAYANLRPWTRMECARIVAAAGEELDEDNSGPDGKHQLQAHQIYAALAVEFSTELNRFRGSGTSEMRLDSIYTRYTGIAGTPLDDSYHFGQTLVDDYGRPYGQGANLISGASAWGAAGAVAFYVRGEYQHAAALPAYSQSVQDLIGTVDDTPPQLPIHTAVIDQARPLGAYVAWNVKSIQASLGYQSLWWGPGESGPPMYSDNAIPMDMLRVTNPSPWRLPGFLSRLGPVRWEFFAGLMAGHHYPPNPAIDGQKISLKPTPNLEFGFSRTIIFKPVTARMFWRGFTSFGDNSTTIPGSPADVGDRRGGFDFSYRIPGLRKWMVLYDDGLTDDDPSPLSAPQRSLMNPGIYLPQIPRIPKLDFRGEAVWSDPPSVANRGGQFFYYNGAYHDAYTNGGQLLGSWVGREGHGLQAWTTYWLSPRSSLQLGYRKAHVDSNFIPGGGNIQDFTARATLQLRHAVEMSTFLQYERWSFPVLLPLAGPDTVASVELTYHPKWRKVRDLR
jgi:membrane-associated phospholipid phosphatase